MSAPDTSPPPNNIDLLRFLLAFVVLLFHARVLTGSPELAALLGPANGHWAVLGFFGLSGYVVSLSWLRRPNLSRFFVRRLRRILPGYLAATVSCFALSPLFSALPLAEFLSQRATWAHLLANLAFLQFLAPDLPGLFTTNPAGAAVNGSLWSIRTEWLCYLLVPLLARHWALPLGLALGGLLLLPHLPQTLYVGLAEPLVSFSLGSLAALLPPPRWLLSVAGLISGTILFADVIPHLDGYSSIWLPAFVLPLALVVPYLGSWIRPFGNLSYGLYLWHFPVLQTLVWCGFAPHSPWLLLAVASGITLLLAGLSWRWVESPFLQSGPSAAAKSG